VSVFVVWLLKGAGNASGYDGAYQAGSGGGDQGGYAEASGYSAAPDNRFIYIRL